MDLKKYLTERKQIIDRELEKYFPAPLSAGIGKEQGMEIGASLQVAIRHSLFAGGKRIRPILCMAAFEAAGGKGDGILPFACALEMIHTYSLIHDDLPALDNDDYRRGKLTCHKAFGEATAILTGDALLTEAFAVMTDTVPRGQPERAWLILDVVHRVARAAGIAGMVSGQVADMAFEGREADLPTLEYIHTHKTGAMILASVQVGARFGQIGEESFKALTRYGERVGLAFQIADDILDVEGELNRLGKRPGCDLSRKKVTYPAVLGIEESRKRARELVNVAVEALSLFGEEADPLREIARFIVTRQY